ncbi:phage minor head protein [Pseudoxanthomonas sp. UTMC 1351]|uniref:phage head morphogenesis protein n=1 Tax=Pseudoxanthomonas sp. UTMC 1351 TaxID=2695853 RepID=UPI0034CF3F69
MTIQSGFDVSPEDALRFFRAKGLRTTFAWQDQWAAEHELAFTVAKMADLDLLADVRDAVDVAIAEGQTLAQFKKQLEPILIKAGWWGQREQADPSSGEKRLVQLGSARRLETIFRTNMMTAYSAGEWTQIEATADSAPYLMYDAVDDTRTREQHRAWDGLVLRWDDPWWNTHRPPNGWNCRCSVIQLGPRDLRAMDRDGPDTAPLVKRREVINTRSGEVMQVPLGIDAGFDYNPGRQRQAQLDLRLAEKRAAFAEGS